MKIIGCGECYWCLADVERARCPGGDVAHWPCACVDVGCPEAWV